MNHVRPKRISLSASEDHKMAGQRKAPIQPRFGEYQLIGDSLLVRFADQILLQPHRIIHGTRTIGYCASGQSIDQLRKRIKLKPYPLSSKIMILIGTSDILCGGSIATMMQHFNALLAVLEKSAERLLILTLPPIPKLCATYYHWTLIRQFNSFLKSLDDGSGIIVADICPMYTKFKAALEYKISAEPQSEQYHFPRRKSSYGQRRKGAFPEQRRAFPDEDRSESDYRNTSDTNTSVDSEAISSELSQEREGLCGTEPQDPAGETGAAKSGKRKDKVETSSRLFLVALRSVLGDDVDVMRRKKAEEQRPKQSEKRPRKSPMDLNDNLHAVDTWKVESDEDSMNEHVYKSQEEIEYDVTDVGNQRKKKKSDEFSKFVVSCNENETPRKGSSYRRLKREGLRNEKQEDTESSSSSDIASPKKQINPFVDHNFRYFLERSWYSSGESDCSFDGELSPLDEDRPPSRSCYYSPPGSDASPANPHPVLESPIFNSKNHYRKFLQSSRGFKHVQGIPERDKTILQLANKICRLECYELFYSFGKRRIDLIHLNHQGLEELKNFLLSNNYVSLL